MSYRRFSTLADMLASSSVIVGDSLETLGRTTVADGGGGLYKVVAAATGTDDGIIYHDMDSVAAQAQLVHGGKINTKQCGIVGDGVTGDYAQLQALFALISANTFHRVDFDGDIYIERTTATDPVGVDLEIENANRVELNFKDGAKLKLKADFEHGPSERSLSFVLRTCNNIDIHNLEVDGQVSTGTKTGTEQGEHALDMFGCKNVNLHSPKLHDCANDGMRIDHVRSGETIITSSENINVWNGDLHNNGRQGLSIIGCFGGSFHDCKFRDTGITGGFGSYSPSLCVDIEPNATTILSVSHIHFYRCSLTGGVGKRLAMVGSADASFDGRVNDVYLHDCDFTTDANATGEDQVICAILRGGIFGGVSNFTTVGGSVSNPRHTPIYQDHHSDFVYERHTFKGPRQCFLATKDAGKTTLQQRVTVRKCRFISTEGSAFGDVRPEIDAGGEFVDNYIFIPAEAYSPGPATRVFVKIHNMDLVEGNTYDTDLATAGRQFIVEHNGSRRVVRETYISPTYFNTSNTAAPTSGTWAVGDRIENPAPSAGAYAAWICVTAGTPGTWKGVDLIEA